MDVASLDLGTANMVALHALDGRRAKMSQGEYRAISKLDSHEEAARHWDERANLPALPDLRRPVAAVLFRYVAVLHHNMDKFLAKYCSEWRLHARLKLRAGVHAFVARFSTAQRIYVINGRRRRHPPAHHALGPKHRVLGPKQSVLGPKRPPRRLERSQLASH